MIKIGKCVESTQQEFAHIKSSEISFFNEIVFGSNNLKNRLLKKKHVDEMQSAILHGSIMPIITINRKTKVVIDGNHTAVALMNLWNKGLCLEKDAVIRWVDIPEEDEMRTIIDININSKNWQLSEIVEKYATESEAFAKIIDFCKEDEFTLDTRGGKEQPKMKYFQAFYRCPWNDLKNPNFTLDEEKLKEARVIRDEVKRMFKAFHFAPVGEWVCPFIDAWVVCREEMTFDDVIEKGVRSWNGGEKVQATVAFNQVQQHLKKNKSAWIGFFNNVVGMLLKNIA